MGTTVEGSGQSVQTGNVDYATNEPTSVSSASQEAARIMAPPLDALAMSDDAIAQIAALMAQGCRDERKASRKLAQIEEKVCAEETAKRVSAMREKAEATRAAGLYTGISQVASAGLQIGGVVAKSEVTRGLLNASAKACEGSGTIGATFEKYDADMLDAEAVEHEGNAQSAQKRADLHRDDMAEAKRMHDKVMEFLKEMRGSQNASASAALRRA